MTTPMSLALLHSASAGELLAAEICVSPRLLEEILEALASAPFPINPELEHAAASGISKICFPLYGSQLGTLQDILVRSGFAASLLEVHSMAVQVAPTENEHSKLVF